MKLEDPMTGKTVERREFVSKDGVRRIGVTRYDGQSERDYSECCELARKHVDQYNQLQTRIRRLALAGIQGVVPY